MYVDRISHNRKVRKQTKDEVSEDSTADRELAKQAGRQTAGSLAPPGKGWKREHESTFLDSDWPSFRNTVHALCLSLSLLCLCSSPHWSSQTNHAKLTSKFDLKGNWISHKTVDLCAAGGSSWANEGSGVGDWMSLLFFNISYALFPHSLPPLHLHISLFFDIPLLSHPSTSLPLCLSVSHSLPHLSPVLRTWVCRSGKPACRLILWPL